MKIKIYNSGQVRTDVLVLGEDESGKEVFAPVCSFTQEQLAAAADNEFEVGELDNYVGFRMHREDGSMSCELEDQDALRNHLCVIGAESGDYFYDSKGGQCEQPANRAAEIMMMLDPACERVNLQDYECGESISRRLYRLPYEPEGEKGQHYVATDSRGNILEDVKGSGNLTPCPSRLNDQWEFKTPDGAAYPKRFHLVARVQGAAADSYAASYRSRSVAAEGQEYSIGSDTPTFPAVARLSGRTPTDAFNETSDFGINDQGGLECVRCNVVDGIPCAWMVAADPVSYYGESTNFSAPLQSLIEGTWGSDFLNTEDLELKHSLSPAAAYLIAATEDGKIAGVADLDTDVTSLPGGALQSGETAEQAAIRSANERGWQVKGELSHVVDQRVEGCLVSWLKSDGVAIPLEQFKELNKVSPVAISVDQLQELGEGNDHPEVVDAAQDAIAAFHQSIEGLNFDPQILRAEDQFNQKSPADELLDSLDSGDLGPSIN